MKRRVALALTAALTLGRADAQQFSGVPTQAYGQFINGYGNAFVVKAAPANFYGVFVTNLTATAGFIVTLNATTAPSAGATLSGSIVECIPIAASAYASVSYNNNPDFYNIGLVVLLSTSCSTYSGGPVGYIKVRAQ